MDEKSEAAIAMFIEALATDRNTAVALVSDGHTTIEEVAYVPLDELLNVQGLNRAQALLLRERALVYLVRRDLRDEDP
jgi:N utilization substance protein A